MKSKMKRFSVPRRFAIYSSMAMALCCVLCPPAKAQNETSDPYQALIKRDYGTASNELAAIEKEVQAPNPDQYARIEDRLLVVIEAPDGTMPGKQFACQMLKAVGSLKCVPAVSKLLTDEKLSHSARTVLLGLHGSAVDDALRAALAKTDGKLRVGIINTIGDRGDAASLDALAAQLKNSDEAASRAAFNAVGKIGGTKAADLLDRNHPAAALKDAWAHAYLRAAASLAATDSKRAEKMYKSLLEGDAPLSIRAAALPPLAQAQKERSAPLVLRWFSSDDTLMRRAAASAIIHVPGNSATKAFAKALPGMPSERKAALVRALAARGDAVGVTAAINKIAADDKDPAQTDAIRALGRLGSAESVPLLPKAIKNAGPASADAAHALVELQAPGTTEALRRQADGAEGPAKEALLKALSERAPLATAADVAAGKGRTALEKSKQ